MVECFWSGGAVVLFEVVIVLISRGEGEKTRAGSHR
jgi:hypothetical protein